MQKVARAGAPEKVTELRGGGAHAQRAGGSSGLQRICWGVNEGFGRGWSAAWGAILLFAPYFCTVTATSLSASVGRLRLFVGGFLEALVPYFARTFLVWSIR